MFDEIKSLIEQQGEAFEGFKAKHADLERELANERKEREALELRLSRAGGGSVSTVDSGALGAERKAVNAFVRNGAQDWTQDAEIKAMSVGSDPDGGYLVLPQLSASMTTRIRDVSPMRMIARVEPMATGDVFEEPDDRDEAGATWIGETAARTATDTPTLGMIRVPLQEIYAMPVATQRLLDDSNRDLGAWLEGKLTDKFARTEGAAFVNGNGIGKPQGILSYTTTTEADTVRDAGVIQHVVTGHASSFASSNPADVLRSLVWTLRTPYRTGAVWLMNSATASTIDKFKDGQGQYIWRDGLTAGQPANLLGYPVYIDEEMEDIGAGNTPVAFGNFQQAYIIVDRPGIKLLRDPYTNKPHVNFYAYTRVGGALANDDAIKLLKVST